MNKDQKVTKEKDVVDDLEKQKADETGSEGKADETEVVEKSEDIEAEGKADETEYEGKSEGTEAEGKETGKVEGAAIEDEELNTKYMRLMADFQNYKRRVTKEKADIYAYANEKIVSELLDVIDNFERALAHAEGDEGFVQGMNNIFKIFKGVLDKSGLEEIEALGMEFDPNFHNAVMTEDSSEFESGVVTQTLQRGYKLNGKVIRPSMVKVAN